MSEQIARRTFLSAGAALAALGISRSTAAADLSAADRTNVAVVKAMAETWRSGDVDKRNSLFAPNRVFRGLANRTENRGSTGPFRAGPNAAHPVIEMHNRDMFALDPIVVTSHYQTFPADRPLPQDDWFVGIFFMQNGLIREWLDWAVWEPKPQVPLPPGFGRIHHGAADQARMSPLDRINVGVVQGMSNAWASNDATAVLSFFDDNCRFRLSGQRVEEPPVVGVKAMREFLSTAGYFSKQKLTIQTHDWLALDPVVLTSQRQLMDDAREAWFIGEFFLQSGRIREWVNYEVVSARPQRRVPDDFGMFKRIAV